MINVIGADGDRIHIFNSVPKQNLVVDLRRRGCQVVGCLNGHLYGWNFCNRHRWIMPVSSDKCPDGFQVALIDYWTKRGVHIMQTHVYEGQKLSLRFRLGQFCRRLLGVKLGKEV